LRRAVDDGSVATCTADPALPSAGKGVRFCIALIHILSNFFKKVKKIRQNSAVWIADVVRGLFWPKAQWPKAGFDTLWKKP